VKARERAGVNRSAQPAPRAQWHQSDVIVAGLCAALLPWFLGHRNWKRSDPCHAGPETRRITIAPQLRRNSLGLGELMFHGITHIAPAANIIFTFPVIALKSGPTMPISFLLTTTVCCFIANTVSEFSKPMPSSGGYYSLAARGLGSRVGFMATWSYLIYDNLGPAASTGFLGYLLSDTLHASFGTNIPWWLIAVATFAIIWVLTYQGIRLSMHITALLGGLEMLIMLALAITFLAHPGPGSSYTAPLKPSQSPHHFGGVLAGMVFSILALSGFEAPAPLAQEARRPARFIGLAAILSLLVIGIFYIFTSYASAIGEPGIWQVSPEIRIRITLWATHCGEQHGGSLSWQSSIALLAPAWPAQTQHPE